MAAPGFSNAVRVRLHFDYPPPATPGCRMSWLFIDLNKCRVVTDVTSIIRDKFDFSRRTALDLFIEDCFLPPNESIYIIRDNDSIRVKAEGFLPALNCNEPSGPSPCKGQKRRRSVEDMPSERDHTKKSKKKKSSRETPDLTAQPEEGERTEHRAEKKRKKEKKTREESTEKEHSQRKKAEPKEKASAADTGSRDGKKPSSCSVKSSAAPSPKPAAAAGKKPSCNRPAPDSSNSSSTDSDSSEDQPASKREQSKTPQSTRAQPKPGTASRGASAKRAPAPSKPVIASAPAPSKPGITSASVPSKPVNVGAASAEGSKQSEVTKAGLVSSVSLSARETPTPAQAETSSSDSSSDDKFVIKKPQTVSGVNRAVIGNGWGRETPLGVGRGSLLGEGRGLGRGGGRFPWRGSVGRGLRGGRTRGTMGQCFSYDYNGSQQQQEKQHLTEKALNTSAVLQYHAEEAPKKDYSSCPLLAAPPQMGQKIAFKLLELTENYTPEVSEYKEGKIIHYIPNTNQVELEILSSDAVCKEPGKFDLVYHTPDGAREIEYAVPRGSNRVTERWDSLIEPRLIIEPGSLPAAGAIG
ncbi:coilin-like [Polyodon spathula]|uniref:coilin-like n=1 Tax=Polyodon spathula TaxID=7913 RepID=UPI001B7DC673|nr:coilin-like [Polyodon spathula]